MRIVPICNQCYRQKQINKNDNRNYTSSLNQQASQNQIHFGTKIDPETLETIRKYLSKSKKPKFVEGALNLLESGIKALSEDGHDEHTLKIVQKVCTIDWIACSKMDVPTLFAQLHSPEGKFVDCLKGVHQHWRSPNTARTATLLDDDTPFFEGFVELINDPEAMAKCFENLNIDQVVERNNERLAALGGKSKPKPKPPKSK